MRPVHTTAAAAVAQDSSKNWLAHLQLASIIFKAVLACKGYKPAVTFLQGAHFVPGLFKDLDESTDDPPLAALVSCAKSSGA